MISLDDAFLVAYTDVTNSYIAAATMSAATTDFYELDFEIINPHLLNYWDSDSKLKILINEK